MAISDTKQIVLRMFDEIINGGKTELIDELFAPDFVSVTPQGSMDRAAFAAFTDAWRAGFADIHCEVSDLVAEGDQVAWKVRARGTHTGEFNGIPATGNSVDFVSLNIGRFRDGQAVEHLVVMDLVTMLTQLGVLSPVG